MADVPYDTALIRCARRRVGREARRARLAQAQAPQGREAGLVVLCLFVSSCGFCSAGRAVYPRAKLERVRKAPTALHWFGTTKRA